MENALEGEIKQEEEKASTNWYYYLGGRRNAVNHFQGDSFCPSAPLIPFIALGVELRAFYVKQKHFSTKIGNPIVCVYLWWLSVIVCVSVCVCECSCACECLFVCLWV